MFPPKWFKLCFHINGPPYSFKGSIQELRSGDDAGDPNLKEIRRL